MSVLCLDAGNTRLKWGLYVPNQGWREQGAFSWTDTETGCLPSADFAVMSNVAGPSAEARVLATLGPVPLMRVQAQAQQCGVSNGYDRPEQLGADRWAALIGAHALCPGPNLIVMAGTATTVDMLDAQGRFQGGLILPGLALMQKSLVHNTAQLAFLSGHYRMQPSNTADAIMSGCLNAQAGAIERQFAQFAGQHQARCLLSGGAADAIAPLLSIPVQRIENLVLEGLMKIAQSTDHFPDAPRSDA